MRSQFGERLCGTFDNTYGTWTNVATKIKKMNAELYVHGFLLEVPLLSLAGRDDRVALSSQGHLVHLVVAVAGSAAGGALLVLHVLRGLRRAVELRGKLAVHLRMGLKMIFQNKIIIGNDIKTTKTTKTTAIMSTQHENSNAQDAMIIHPQKNLPA